MGVRGFCPNRMVGGGVLLLGYADSLHAVTPTGTMSLDISPGLCDMAVDSSGEVLALVGSPHRESTHLRCWSPDGLRAVPDRPCAGRRISIAASGAVAVADSDSVTVYADRTLEQSRAHHPLGGSARALAATDDGWVVVLDNKRVSVIQGAAHHVVRRLGDVRSVWVEGARAWVGNKAGVVHEIDTHAAKRVRSLRGHADAVLAITALPDGGLLTASQSGDIHVWESDGRRRCRVWLTQDLQWLIQHTDGSWNASDGFSAVAWGYGGTLPAGHLRHQLTRAELPGGRCPELWFAAG